MSLFTSGTSAARPPCRVVVYFNPLDHDQRGLMDEHRFDGETGVSCAVIARRLSLMFVSITPHHLLLFSDSQKGFSVQNSRFPSIP